MLKNALRITWKEKVQGILKATNPKKLFTGKVSPINPMLLNERWKLKVGQKRKKQI
jgi:hypothetical protein